MTDGLEDTHIVDPLLHRVIAGKMELRQVLGAGAMGVVYRAHHLALDKQVAIKVLKSEGKSDPTRARRFKAEARAASRLDHPNSVHILDFGEDGPDGLLYLAMEFLEGEDLQSTLRRERALSPERASRIMVQVLGALAAAHESGVIHRDMKPGNIMLLSRTDDDGRPRDHVKVCDFGLAKILDNLDDASGAPLTKQGSIFGTPSYMSPEQARGEALDGRSDVYACGVILYRMLTGESPFNADSAWGILMKHLNEPPPPMSQWVPDLPPELVRITERALMKDREQRFASAREMRAAIKAFLRDAGEEGDVSSPTPAVAPIERSPSLTVPGPAPRAPSRTVPAETVVEAARAAAEAPVAAATVAAPIVAASVPAASVVAASVPAADRRPIVAAVIAAALAVVAVFAWWSSRAPEATPLEAAPVLAAADPAPRAEPTASAMAEPPALAEPSALAASPPPEATPPSASAAPEPASEPEPSAAKRRRPTARAESPAPRASATSAPSAVAEPAATAAAPIATAAPTATPIATAAPTATPIATAAPAPTPSAPTAAPKPITAVTLGITHVKVTGGMSGRKIEQGVDKQLPKIQECLLGQARAGHRLAPAIEVRGTIDLGGRLRKVSASGAQGACVSAALEGASFPKPDTGEALVSFSLEVRGS